MVRLLDAADAEGGLATDELLPLVYADLRKLAAWRLARLGPAQTLQATALVHETYLRLVGSRETDWRERAHFFGAAARAMRNILVDELRRKDSLKRGGHFRRVGEDTIVALTAEGPSDASLVIEEVLEDFEVDHPRKAEVVTLRFFGGLDSDEIAEVLGLSTRTVERDWAFAKAWLNGRLTQREAGA